MNKKKIPIEEGLFYIPDSSEEKPYLIGSRCTLCGVVIFPKVSVCSHCGKKDITEEIHLDGKGTIDTFCIVQSALPGFKSPSAQAFINLNAGPRVWGIITDYGQSEEDLAIGMDVELVIVKVREDAEGNEIMSYQFRPLGDAAKGGQS